MKDLYTILGVPKTADRDAIKKAYRKLARDKHPDLDPDNPWAEDEFKELSAAYDLLSNDVKRGQYDRGEIDGDGNKIKSHRTTNRSRASNHGFSGNDASSERPFDWYFKNRKKRDNGGVKVKGANVTYSLSVEFLEAALGAEKQVSMTNGKRLNVKIPPGTEDGQTLRLKGQGTPGIGGAEPGDALVDINVNPSPLYRRRGLDITVDAMVDLDVAVLGGKISTKTIHGTVQVTVPTGSNSGSLLRLKGRGIRQSDSKQGDHFVKLLVKLPDHIDAELEKALKAWAERVQKTETEA